MKICFSHGKESGPWGLKIKRLAKLAEGMGCAVESIHYKNLMDPDLRVERLLEALARADDSFVLVGSSMGGHVSLVASETVKQLEAALEEFRSVEEVLAVTNG
jgi:predicted esterase YcpF (UPF0227 family)